MSKHENDPRYVSSDRVRKLAFLFRADIAERLRKPKAELDMCASIISGALRGDDDSNEGTRQLIDMVIESFHPDKEQRRAAAQRTLDDLEFGFDSEIKQAEYRGDLEGAETLRRHKRSARADLEQTYGELQHRVAIDAATPPARDAP